MDEQKVAVAMAVHQEKIETIDGKVDQLVHAIIGNGKPGLMTRIDRIEQSERFKNRVLWAVFVAILGIIGTLVTDRITAEPAPTAVKQR